MTTRKTRLRWAFAPSGAVEFNGIDGATFIIRGRTESGRYHEIRAPFDRSALRELFDSAKKALEEQRDALLQQADMDAISVGRKAP